MFLFLCVLFLSENLCCGFSFDLPWQGCSNEYLQNTFLQRDNENTNDFKKKENKTIFGKKKLPCLELR